MDIMAILAIANAVMDIQERHFKATGEVLTKARVLELLREEIDRGDLMSDAWFREKGLTPPE